MTRRVGIIGAGISGLLACKYIRGKGFHPIVFEAKSSIGGVWTKTLDNTKLQTPKPMFQFSDFPWPSSVTQDFPDQHQVLNYITAYAHHFDLLKYIMFDAQVQGIEYQGPTLEEMQAWHLWGGTGEPFTSKGKWTVLVKNTEKDSSSVEVYTVDFVILCIGRFSDVPNIPEFPPNKGPEVFGGKVIHSMDYSSMDSQSAAELVKGKLVTVVGFQKSALDTAMECSAANGVEHPCRVLYRTPHWNLPDYLPWGIPLGYLYLNRFAELMVHKPNEGFLLSVIASLLAPVRWAFSKLVESHIRRKLGLVKFGMVPNHSFLREMNSCLFSTVPENFYDKVEQGSIILKKAPRFWFCKEGVLVGGEALPIKTDLVILATGFRGEKKLQDIFVSSAFQNLIAGSPNATIPLYRECIHPQIPQLAVIGFSESASNLYTSEMRCRWVAELLDGTFQLPNIDEMMRDVGKWKEYLKKYAGVRYYRRSCIAALHIWYNDQLCKDMGWSPTRKKGLLAELFEPYGPSDYCS